jgi:four helix bundle protein
MSSIQSFKDLKVWQQGMELSVEAYRITSSFPKAEIFGLSSQIRRAAASVPANIAEGWGREGTKEFIQFLRTAQGSLSELETHLILDQRLQLLPGSCDTLFQQLESVSKMLRSLIRSLQRSMPLAK